MQDPAAWERVIELSQASPMLSRVTEFCRITDQLQRPRSAKSTSPVSTGEVAGIATASIA